MGKSGAVVVGWRENYSGASARAGTFCLGGKIQSSAKMDTLFLRNSLVGVVIFFSSNFLLCNSVVGGRFRYDE